MSWLQNNNKDPDKYLRVQQIPKKVTKKNMVIIVK